MGTHPIFESDFDCLTEREKMETRRANRMNTATTNAEQIANQKALATRQRGALGEIRTTRAQQLRNKMIQKNQEAKIPAKRPLTELKTPQKEIQSVKMYLTQEEYEEQGKRETDLALVSLRDQINSSPEPMKLLKKLHPDTRNLVIDFATGADSEDFGLQDLDLKSQSDEEDIDSTDGELTSTPRTPLPPTTPRTPRQNHANNLRRQVLQKNTSRPIWK